MMALIVFLLVAASVVYAFALNRSEERRQQWRRDSRATWLKAG